LGRPSRDPDVNQIPRPIKRQLRELAGVAHERELAKALDGLARAFGRWRAGELNSFQLNDAIHEFHNGRSRELWVRYATAHSEPSVAYAIVAGVLEKREVPAELLEHLQSLIKFYESEIHESS
jgi:hypothetical protein